MRDDWEIYLSTARGSRVRMVEDAIAWTLVKNANQVGEFALQVPFRGSGQDWPVDGVVEFWRAGGGSLRLEGIGFVRKLDYRQGESETILTVSGPDQNDLLNRRIVAYNANTSYTNKSNQADDMMRDVVRENLGASATDATRKWDGIGLSVESDLTLGPSIDLAFSRAGVLETLQKAAKASEQGGTALWFQLKPGWSSGLLTLRFEVRKDYLGRDRVSEGTPVVFGEELGNLAGAMLVEDYGEEVNYVYGGGAGNDDARYVYGLGDDGRIGRSVWNRREGWVDARNCTTEAEVQSKVKAALENGKPKLRFSGSLLEIENMRYGRDWDWGDWVSCSFVGKQFSGMVQAVRLEVDEQGNETIEARFEVEQ